MDLSEKNIQNPSLENVLTKEAWERAYDKGREKVSNSDYEGACIAYKTAKALNPKNAEISNHLGIVYFHMKEYKEAFKFFEEALALDPNNENAKANLELIKKYIK